MKLFSSLLVIDKSWRFHTKYLLWDVLINKDKKN